MSSANPLYNVWSGMIRRCSNPATRFYADYGGRGISVCGRWAGSFQAFQDDMGPRPEGKYPSGRALYSIDRIDVNGNYEPSNCRWATQGEQLRNRRKSLRRPPSRASNVDATETVFLRVAEGDHEWLRDVASRRGLSKSAYILGCGLGFVTPAAEAPCSVGMATSRIGLRMTPDDLTELRRLAVRARLTVSAYLLGCSLGRRLPCDHGVPVGEECVPCALEQPAENLPTPNTGQ